MVNYYREKMRALSLRSCCCLVILTLVNTGYGATWVVDKNESNQPDFTSLTTALETATAGDIIYLAPAGGDYGTLTIDKSITIIGSGFGKPETAPEGPLTESSIRNIVVSGSASNVFLSGLVIDYDVEVTGGASGVTLFRNEVHGGIETLVGDGPITNLLVVNNVIRAVRMGSSRTPRVNGFFFANNICEDFRFYPGDVQILNNVFEQASGGNRMLDIDLGGSIPNLIASGVARNNIFIFGTIDFSPADCAFSHNLFDIAGNLTVGETDLRFREADEIVVNVGEYGAKYVLVENSPAIGAGSDGSDIGIFGGPHPWNLNHQPPIPFITRFDAPTLLGAGDSLQVTIEAQSNN